MAFFIKRGEKVHGPFTTDQIKSGVKNGEVKASDVISNSKEGPWQPLADAISKPQPPVDPQETDLPELQPLETATPPLEADTLDSGVSSASWSQSPAPPTTTTPSTGKKRLVIGGLVGTVAILLVVVVVLLSRTQSGSDGTTPEVATTETGSPKTTKKKARSSQPKAWHAMMFKSSFANVERAYQKYSDANLRFITTEDPLDRGAITSAYQSFMGAVNNFHENIFKEHSWGATAEEVLDVQTKMTRICHKTLEQEKNITKSVDWFFFWNKDLIALMRENAYLGPKDEEALKKWKEENQ